MGGQLYGTGGRGGYTSGNIYLNAGTNLYIYVGGRNNTIAAPFNGGGIGETTPSTGVYRSSGGGSTDIRFWGNNIPTYSNSNLNWNNATGLNNRIMVAAGGGGGATYTINLTGAYGGGLSGGNGIANQTETYTTTTVNAAIGATQTSGSDFGYASQAAGGGGYYGGRRGGAVGYVSSGSGGSSFISGHSGCNAITSITNRTHTGQPNHYSGMIFTNTVMTAGNASMPNPNGGTQTGHGSTGVAVITFVGP